LSFAVRETEVPNFAGTRMNTGFDGNLTLHVQPWPMPSRNGKKSGRQDSNLQERPDLEALANAAPQLAPQGPDWPEEVGEIARSWALLPEALKAAVLGIVRSVRKEGK
jgi:hypothetical protein